MLDTSFECSICKIETNQEKTIYQCCNNEVCLKCRNKWFLKNQSCPFCRSKDNITIDYYNIVSKYLDVNNEIDHLNEQLRILNSKKEEYEQFILNVTESKGKLTKNNIIETFEKISDDNERNNRITSDMISKNWTKRVFVYKDV